MQENRGLLKLILLSLITFGIYGLWFWSKYASDMNVVCAGDGRKTRGILARILLSLITFGIYEWVWEYGVGERIMINCQKRGIPCTTSGGNILLWSILGSLLFGIGPLVACYKMIHGLNDLCIDYNRNGGGMNRGGVNVKVDVYNN
ncbi:MAG: DUF4234 domain-containing protein [Clostridia bacterium]|nr:DUF4234 domain-containing protein [Clostridia bacterium]